MDELSTLLFWVFEGKGTLLGLMRVLIEREVTMTNHESELFRANSITMRMITVFAKTYGYNHVWVTLQPLILSLAEKPAECSFELDPNFPLCILFSNQTPLETTRGLNASLEARNGTSLMTAATRFSRDLKHWLRTES